jgi:hypothetical protein
MGPLSTGRLVAGLAVIALLAVLVWQTMEPGKYQQVTWLLLGFFAARILLSWMRQRRIEKKEEKPSKTADQPSSKLM